MIQARETEFEPRNDNNTRGCLWCVSRYDYPATSAFIDLWAVNLQNFGSAKIEFIPSLSCWYPGICKISRSSNVPGHLGFSAEMPALQKHLVSAENRKTCQNASGTWCFHFEQTFLQQLKIAFHEEDRYFVLYFEVPFIVKAYCISTWIVCRVPMYLAKIFLQCLTIFICRIFYMLGFYVRKFTIDGVLYKYLSTTGWKCTTHTWICKN